MLSGYEQQCTRRMQTCLENDVSDWKSTHGATILDVPYGSSGRSEGIWNSTDCVTLFVSWTAPAGTINSIPGMCIMPPVLVKVFDTSACSKYFLVCLEKVSSCFSVEEACVGSSSGSTVKQICSIDTITSKEGLLAHVHWSRKHSFELNKKVFITQMITSSQTVE